MYITKDIPILFSADLLGTLFLILTVAMWIMDLVFSIEYMKHDRHKRRYYVFYVLTLVSMIGVCLAGNLITIYICYEFMTLMSLPLVLHEQTDEALKAGRKYFFYSLGGAFIGLAGFFFIYIYGTSLTFTPGGVLNFSKLAGRETAMLTVTLLVIIGFGSKAGMFPLHAWLPTAHPVAPSPASAFLSGNITKMGVLMIIRFVYYLVGPDFIRGTWVQYTWMVLALLTVFLGSMMAYTEKVMKKRFAYSTVSQVSYVLFGLSLLSETGFNGALLHVVFHSVIKDGLFLVAGAIIVYTGIKNVDQLRGIAKRMPTVIWCFTFFALALVGIPPASGFVSKWYLCLGALEGDIGAFRFVGPAVLLISALLTAGYLLPITINGFFPGNDFDYSSCKKCKVSPLMIVPLVILAVAAVGFGLFPDFIMNGISDITAGLF